MQTYRLLHDPLDAWAEIKPNAPAVISATHGVTTTWAELRHGSLRIAASLISMGFHRGDKLAASLPLSTVHIQLEYACFRLGVIHVPLDLRLTAPEIEKSLRAVDARGYIFTSRTPVEQIPEVVEHRIRLAPPDDTREGTVPFSRLLEGEPRLLTGQGEPEEGAQIIFTTGSTGSPKPALLSHRGILAQNRCLAKAFGFSPDGRVLCNLPASHVGGQAELLLTTLAAGGTAVTLDTFDPALSLRAIEEHRVTLLGQIPAMFQMEWRSGDYGKRDLSSLQTVVYGGQSVPPDFLGRMRTMAPQIATGLGLTEASGFCTYTPLTSDAAQIGRTLGAADPEYPMSIRHPMRADGRAGDELPDGEVGHVCFRGPQTFIGYVGDPTATTATISSDGWLYTGDMGAIHSDGLRLSGRAKWILKPRGYQVFPGDVEDHFSALSDSVANVGVVGHEHELWSEAIVAFIEKRPGAELTEADLRRHARGLASYMRPSHYVLLEAGELPLNRVAKIDVERLGQMAREEVRQLRQQGRWDRSTR